MAESHRETYITYIYKYARKAKNVNDELINLLIRSIQSLPSEVIVDKRSEKSLKKIIKCIFLKCEITNIEELRDLETLMDKASLNEEIVKLLAKSVRKAMEYRNANKSTFDIILKGSEARDSGYYGGNIPRRIKWFRKGEQGWSAAQKICESNCQKRDSANFSIDELDSGEEEMSDDPRRRDESRDDENSTSEDDCTTRLKYETGPGSLQNQPSDHNEGNEDSTLEDESVSAEDVKTPTLHNICIGQIRCEEDDYWRQKSESAREEWALTVINSLKRAADHLVFLSVSTGSILIRFAIRSSDNDVQAANRAIHMALAELGTSIPDPTSHNGHRYEISDTYFSRKGVWTNVALTLETPSGTEVNPAFKEAIKEMVLRKFAEQDRMANCLAITNFHVLENLDANRTFSENISGIRETENPSLPREETL